MTMRKSVWRQNTNFSNLRLEVDLPKNRVPLSKLVCYSVIKLLQFFCHVCPPNMFLKTGSKDTLSMWSYVLVFVFPTISRASITAHGKMTSLFSTSHNKSFIRIVITKTCFVCILNISQQSSKINCNYAFQMSIPAKFTWVDSPLTNWKNLKVTDYIGGY